MKTLYYNFYLWPARLMLLVLTGILWSSGFALAGNDDLKLNDSGYFEKRGINVLVFSNWYDGNFSDAKISGIEIIHHGVRTATNGDVRLNSTPGQWDPVPELISRKISPETNFIEAFLKYPKYEFTYSIKTEARDGGVYISVNLDKPLPEVLNGKAGLNLEFLPSAYFEKTYLTDEGSGVFPLYPGGPMFLKQSGVSDPHPFAKGKKLVLSPEDPATGITIQTMDGELLLFDGRNQAQNGWYVVRTLIPAGRSGKVIEWFLTANTIDNWTRSPVISHSQVGYHPDQEKIAVMEQDKNDSIIIAAQLLKVNDDGHTVVAYTSKPEKWGRYLRYTYSKFDFSDVKEEGVYVIEYGRERTKPFRIAKDVYEKAWQPTLDIFMPVQMDHMFVNEAYRVWHGASHLDDALQAPVNYEHFDLYAQGPKTDSPYKPGEHIPGLNIGGWFDAGDFDIRTQTHYGLLITLVHAWETFPIKRDETTIDQKRRYVDIHVPDGTPDMLQQIEHGTLALIAQHRAVGHAIPGIIAPDLTQYTHLGDASTITDNLICTAPPKAIKWEEFTRSNCDDRWAFTSKSTPLNYGSIAALAAASRVLRGYNDTLAAECIATAKKVWDEEHQHEPDIFRFGNTTGGPLEQEELTAAVELLICTKEAKYANRILDLLPYIEKQFNRVAFTAILAIPYMNGSYKVAMERLVQKYKQNIDAYSLNNPFGVFISPGGWAGNGQVIHGAITNYLLHKAFPEIIGPEYVFRGLHYIYGCHPGSDISFVSGVGTHSKRVAYGNNRADFSFIAGGIVPGVLLLKPDFPENKEDWPFFWGENEYVISLAASYIYLVNAANDLLN
jgi:endoglucanase